MQEIKLVGSHQRYSPFPISILSSGRELYDLRRSEVGGSDIARNSATSQPTRRCRRTPSGAAREAAVWRPDRAG
jgi:hypothetical protein